MQSISNLVTAERAQEFVNSFLDFGGTTEAGKEAAILIRPNMADENDKNSQLPFMILGNFVGVNEWTNEEGNKQRLYYFTTNYMLNGEPHAICVKMYGFGSLNTQFDKLQPKEGADIKLKYSGKAPHPKKKDKYFHSCFFNVLGNEGTTATAQMYKDNKDTE